MSLVLDTQLKTSAVPMSGGLAEVAGVGQLNIFTIGGTWAVGDTVSIIFTESLTGTQVQVGSGRVTGSLVTFCFTYGGKVYLLAGPLVHFSAIELPRVFNDPEAVGNGSVQMTNYYSAPENLVAIAPFQGQLAFFSRSTVQIWSTPADPAEWKQNQVLQNIGTFAPLSVQPLGDLDVFFLTDSGIRNLRAREASLNAFVADVGSPIDQVIQAALATCTATEKAAACGVVEPESGRYWLYLKGNIYVLSYFPASKIVAWSIYKPTYELAGVQTTFVPERFVVFNGQVYCRAGDNLFQYGGSTGQIYDNCVAIAEVPYLDLKKPSTRKMATGFDVAMSGAWTLKAGMDPRTGTLEDVYSASTHSFDAGHVPYSSQGTHVKVRAVSSGSAAAILSELIFKYQAGEEE